MGATQVKPLSCQFDDHRHYGSGDKIVLVGHVIFQDYVFKASCDFIGRSQHSTKFGGHKHWGSGDKKALVCQVILQDPVIIASCDLMGISSLK